MNKDVHPHLGVKQRYASMEDCIKAVRKIHPTATCEGSTGRERSFWVQSILVAHAWPIRNSNDFWLRCFRDRPEMTDAASHGKGYM